MPIPLRTDYDASALRSCAKKTKDGPQARRLFALAAIYDGGASVSVAANGRSATMSISRQGIINSRIPDARAVDRLIFRPPFFAPAAC